MKTPARILFIGHDANRAGAPMVLLHLMRWLRENTELRFDLALRAGGPLVQDYRAVCDRVFDINVPELLRAISNGNIGLIYSNTVTNGAVLEALAPARLPVICHAHEVTTYFRRMPASELSQLAAAATLYLAGTWTIAADLVRVGVPDRAIHRCPNFVPMPRGRRDDATRRGFRSRHQIPETAVLAGGAGGVHWQKGVDLLVALARMLVNRADARDIHLIWVGGEPGDPLIGQLEWDISRAGLAGRFTLLPATSDLSSLFSALDMFVLPSRDDPSPMVAIEAGAAGLPVICFEGNAVIVDHQCGRVVPYLDVDGLATALIELAADEALRVHLGETLRQRVRAKHDIALVAPRIAVLIRETLAAASAARS